MKNVALNGIRAATLFGTLMALTVSLQVQGAAAKPNIVVILADDLGYADTGYQGSPDMVTPHIDSIARSGVRFSAGYVTAPVCAPSRAGFLSGMYQNRYGFEDNPGPYKLRADVKIGIPKTVKLLPERMKALGYATDMVGKSHTGDDPEFLPINSGFDEFFGFNYGASNYRPDGRWGNRILNWRFNDAWAIRDNEWKLVKARESKSPQLFRIATDISEKQDISAEQPDVVQRLQTAHDAWNKALMPKLWGWNKSFPIYDPRPGIAE